MCSLSEIPAALATLPREPPRRGGAQRGSGTARAQTVQCITWGQNNKICIYIYIYIYRDIYVCVYIYIYIYKVTPTPDFRNLPRRKKTQKEKHTGRRGVARRQESGLWGFSCWALLVTLPAHIIVVVIIIISITSMCVIVIVIVIIIIMIIIIISSSSSSIWLPITLPARRLDRTGRSQRARAVTASCTCPARRLAG